MSTNGIPEKIGRYTVERMLGQGAMGSVYLGRDQELDRAVAIKTVRDLDLEDSRLRIFLERFKNEARAAARLSHPTIVAVYDVGEDEGVGPYLVFEYVAGSSLRQILRGRGPMPAEAVVKLGRQIAAALDTAHAAGVIHRDVKPDNILMAPSGDAKLADFGVARVPDAALTKEGQFLGTPCYAAPETLGSGRYGPHSDNFSFAAVMYEAMTARRAFPGDDAISVAHRVVHDTPEEPSSIAPDVRIPREVDRVVMRGLDKNPDRRFETAMGFVDALAAAYIASGVLDRDPTGAQVLPTPEPRSESRGSTWAFAAVVLGLLAVGIAFVAAFVDWGPGDTGDLGTDPLLATEVDAATGPPDAGLDAGGLLEAGVDAALDASPDAGGDRDSGLPDVSGMSAFDRDEAAKDEVAGARRALEEGDLETAETALARARAYDPGNADIGALEAQIAEARLSRSR